MNKGLSHRAHYPALDGMRGLAILLVVIYHNFNFINYSYFGWLGVDLFFVLSGFLITNILLDGYGKPHYLRNFYIKRVLRIFPLYFTFLAVMLLVVAHWYPQKMEYYTTHQAWLWTFMQNWLYIFWQPYGYSALLHLWSLSVEEQFYLLWPFIILLLAKPKRMLVFMMMLLVLVFALRLFVWIREIESLAYYNLYTFSRIDGLCIGCMVALILRISPNFLSRNTTTIVLFFAGFNFLFDFINHFYNFRFPFLALVGYTTFAMLFGLLVHEGTRDNNNWVKVLFNFSALRFLGKISYGFYIFHWPIYVLLNPHIAQWIQEHYYSHSILLSSIICTLAALVISILSFYFFEMKFLKLKDRFAQ